MLILGIDPGTATTGVGIIEKKINGLKALTSGVIRTAAGEPTAKRLETIYEDVGQLIAKYRPQVAAVEKLYFNTNAKTAISVGQARGVAVLSCSRAGLAVAEYTPLEVKMAVCGYGRARKEQVQRMVGTLLSLRENPSPSDAADALAVAICHAHSLHIGAYRSSSST